jgi:cysteinyl-tRNA synthetase
MLDSNLVKSLCDQHAKKYEEEFFKDLKKLGIALPDVIVRVSEYIPSVIKMVEKICENGFGYEYKGSVYFDTSRFNEHPNHFYGKLEPQNYGNVALLEEGEGQLAATEGKKRAADFALWKASKPGEPSWESPWGLGRPGWHIECSAMASEILGEKIDIHCGGVDLKFPHHDNEMAQSEAYFQNDQWINYFFHSGHLHIDGLKMSKSLKNFITIGDTLKKYNPREIRFLFLLQDWDRPMNYQRQNTMAVVDSKIKTFREFFRKVNMAMMNRNVPENWNSKDFELHEDLLTTQKNVHTHLCNNFKTSHVISDLINIVNKGNVYMTNNPNKKGLLLRKISNYIIHILDIFGINMSLDEDLSSKGSEAGGLSRKSEKDIVHPYVASAVQFRKNVRSLVKENKPSTEILDLCDQFRDETMPHLGIKIVDDGEFDFYFVDKDTLIKEIEQQKAEKTKRMEQKASVELKKLKSRLNARLKERSNWEKFKQKPEEVILQDFDIQISSLEQLPDINITLSGKDLSKGLKKKITKFWKAQEKNHNKFLERLEKDPHFIDKLDDEIKEIKDKLGNK